MLIYYFHILKKNIVLTCFFLLATASHAGAFEDFFADAELNPNASLITGSICGYKVQEIEDPLMRQIRVLDKVVDELARGRAVERIQRTAS